MQTVFQLQGHFCMLSFIFSLISDKPSFRVIVFVVIYILHFGMDMSIFLCCTSNYNLSATPSGGGSGETSKFPLNKKPETNDNPCVTLPKFHKTKSPQAEAREPKAKLFNYFIASSTATAQATVAPTIGLLPIPMRPIISTCAGTEDEPAN